MASLAGKGIKYVASSFGKTIVKAGKRLGEGVTMVAGKAGKAAVDGIKTTSHKVKEGVNFVASTAKGFADKIGSLWNKGATTVKTTFLQGNEKIQHAVKTLLEYKWIPGEGKGFAMTGVGKVSGGGQYSLKEAYQYMESKVVKGTGKIDYDLAKDYIRDVESKTGLKLHKNQIEQLKAALREHKYEKMTPLETLKHRNKFNSVKNKLISEWEEKTGQTWPRYTEEVYDKKGRVARDIGQPYDAHHIIENNFGGPHEWWNIHPAKFPDEHQAGIHGKGSPSNKLFPRR